jgi:hypothetical protein
MAESVGGVDDHVYLDARSIGARFEERFPFITQSCRNAGIEPTRDLIPVSPAAHYTCGGIVSNMDGTTEVEGLFAVGEVAYTGVHGANRLAERLEKEGLGAAAIHGKGFNTGRGVLGEGDGSGAGVHGTGGASDGSGVTGTGGATNGHGVVGTGTGSGEGVRGTGGSSSGNGVQGTGGAGGKGVVGTGGSSDGAGVEGTGGATNGVGVAGVGTGSGAGVTGQSTTGHGATLSGNATRGPLLLTPQSSNPSTATKGSLCANDTGGAIQLGDGTNWLKLVANLFTNSESSDTETTEGGGQTYSWPTITLPTLPANVLRVGSQIRGRLVIVVVPRTTPGDFSIVVPPPIFEANFYSAFDAAAFSGGVGIITIDFVTTILTIGAGGTCRSSVRATVTDVNDVGTADWEGGAAPTAVYTEDSLNGYDTTTSKGLGVSYLAVAGSGGSFSTYIRDYSVDVIL